MGPALDLGHLGLGEFDCELVIVVSELSFRECGKKQTSKSLISIHFHFEHELWLLDHGCMLCACAC